MSQDSPVTHNHQLSHTKTTDVTRLTSHTQPPTVTYRDNRCHKTHQSHTTTNCHIQRQYMSQDSPVTNKHQLSHTETINVTRLTSHKETPTVTYRDNRCHKTHTVTYGDTPTCHLALWFYFEQERGRCELVLTSLCLVRQLTLCGTHLHDAYNWSSSREQVMCVSYMCESNTCV